jgi:hypothetical protein
MERKFNFVSADKHYSYQIDISMENPENPDKATWSVCGSIWDMSLSSRKCYKSLISGGQCLDHEEFRMLAKEHPAVDKILSLWKKWHLNDLTAGSPNQTKKVEEWRAEHNKDNHSDYEDVCEYLKSIDLLADKDFIYNGKPYVYGSAWLLTKIDTNDYQDMLVIMNNDNTPKKLDEIFS